MTKQKQEDVIAPGNMADIPADEADSIVPGGAQGGVVARARRAAAKAARPAVARARARVRMTFQAVDLEEGEAA